MTNVSKEIYTKMNTSHIFDPMPNQSSQAMTSRNNKSKQEPLQPISESKNSKQSKNIKPIKIELKGENAPSAKKNVLKPFINKEKGNQDDYKVDVIKNRYHNSSDIFFTKALSPSMKQQLKDEAFPKKKKYISNYDPENYLKFHSSFDNKMHDLYHEKGDKLTSNKKKEKGKPKKIQVSSKGYNEYLNKYNNENYSQLIELSKDHKINHKGTEKFIYNRQNKFKPNSTSHANYDRGFESDIFNYKNKNYKKFMKKDKKEKLNNSVDYSELRSRKVKGNCKWPADMNWTKNSELVFKTHIRNLNKNKSMSSFDRFHVDNVKNLIENIDEKDTQNKKIRRNRSDLGLGSNDIKRPIFENNRYNISRAKKLSNNFSVLDNEKTYRNNFKIKNSGKKLDEKEYIIDKPGNMDIIEFSKLMKSKGIHLIDVKEKADIIENENKNNKDRIIHFKIREDINDKKNNSDLKKIETILKKNNKELEIKPAPKKKGYGLKEIDFYDKGKSWKNKSVDNVHI